MNASTAGAWLTLSRTLPDDVKQRQMYASLDGRRIAVLLYGEVTTLSIPPGHHELRVHNTLSRKRVEFDAEPGQHLRFSLANTAGKGFLYWVLFAGVALMWTRVTRESDGEPPADPAPETFHVW